MTPEKHPITGLSIRRENHPSALKDDSLYKQCLKEEDEWYPGKEDGCFVASVVYGNPNAEQVNVLRDYRDTVLKTTSAGRAFVNFYYSGAGKLAAEIVKTHLPSTIPAIRLGLDILVERHKSKR